MKTSKPRTTNASATVAKDGLENVIAGVGNSKDKKSYASYQVVIKDRVTLENAYRTSWISNRIVSSVADDMTRKWRDFSIEDDDGTAIKAIEREERRLNVRGKTNEGLRWGRLYGGSLILIGTEDAKADPKVLATKLDVESIGLGGLSYLQVIDRWRVSPSAELVTDLDSPDFGLPISYSVAESGITYHHSRVLRFDGQKLPYYPWFANARWSDSVLVSVWDAVLNKDTASAVSGSLIYESKVDVVKIPNLGDLVSTRDGEANLIKRLNLASMMKSVNNTLVIGGEEDYEQKSYTFGGLDTLLDKFSDDVCGAAEIPRTRLFGQSPGGLNATGDGDLANYYDSIHSKQESDLRPQLEKLDQILIRSALGEMPEEYEFDFNSLWQMSDVDKAKVELSNAQRDQIYLSLGVLTEVAVAKTLQTSGTYSGLTDEDVELAGSLRAPALTQATVDPFKEEDKNAN
ncbi:MAG: DUF1073 domain-containing protein [Pseudomonadota bacterium]